MKEEALRLAEAEAKEFLRRAKVFRDEKPNFAFYWPGSPASASLRRQSMELTRALAQLRKPA